MKAAVTIVALLALLVALINADGTMTANFQMRASYLKGGVVVGTVSYQWGTGAGGGFLRYDYTKQNYYELLSYNSNNGYGGGSTPFINQWNYQVGASCACETGAIDGVMPPLVQAAAPAFEATVLSTGFIKSTTTINGVAVNLYTLTGDANVAPLYSGISGYAVSIAYKVSDNTVYQLTYDDGREFTFSNVQLGAAIESSSFAAPPGCKCGRPIDIVIVLDRSGSISALSWYSQKSFMVNFTKQFDYGPLAANIAVINFNHVFWTTLTIAQGVTSDNVFTTIGAMACNDAVGGCNPDANDYVANPDISCCCCGTSISGGMRYGADALALSTRNYATKVMLTITDGYHNTQMDGDQCSAYVPGGCSGDLIDSVAYVEQTIPGIVMYGVGVGNTRLYSIAEVLICAQNQTSRLLTVGNFALLASSTLELVAKTCDQNTEPCGGCCGFCVCATCQPVDQCDAPSDLCTLSVPPSGGQTCCSTTPVVCPTNDACNSYACNPANGNCTGTATPTPPDTDCITWSCDPSTGVHSTATPATCPTGPQPDCNASNAVTACNDNNACTVDSCDTSLALAKCKWTTLNCSISTPPDQCSQVACDVKKGCVRTPFPASYCDDQNVCTVDTCDPVQGCLHTPINCYDRNGTNITDFCTIVTCHPVLGCLYNAKVCNASVAAASLQSGVPQDQIDINCIIGFCANGTCLTRILTCPAGIATPVIVGAALGTAAIIGIALAAIIAGIAVAGGGAYAYSQAAGDGGAAVTGNNPIYAGNQNAGFNPLYQQ